MTFLSFCLFVRLTLIQSKGYPTFGPIFDAGDVFTMANKDKNRYGKIAGAIKGKTIVDKVIKHAAIILVRLTILVT